MYVAQKGTKPVFEVARIVFLALTLQEILAFDDLKNPMFYLFPPRLVLRARKLCICVKYQKLFSHSGYVRFPCFQWSLCFPPGAAINCPVHWHAMYMIQYGHDAWAPVSQKAIFRHRFLNVRMCVSWRTLVVTNRNV